MSRPSLPEFVHHLRAAVTIASVVAALTALGLTGALDAASLQLGFDITSIAKIERQLSPDYPRLRSIDEKSYGEIFDATSPLDRPKLAGVIDRLIRARTKLLVIDIDLAPSPRGSSSDPTATGQRQLDEVLDRAPIDLVIPNSTPSANAAADIEHLRWMQERCAKNAHVHFAYTDLRASNGLVVRYDPALPTLAILARRLWYADRAAREAHEIPWEPRALCDALSLDAPNSLQQLHDALRSEALEPIDFTQARASASGSAPCGVTPCEPLENRVVFLGGSYDPRDRFSTPLGPVDGVAIHAAIFNSRTRTISHALAISFEILVGLGAGFLLAPVWSRQNAEAMEFERLTRERLRNPVAVPLTALHGSWLKTCILAVLAILASVAIVCAVLVMSSVGLLGGTWINPGPIVFGMCIDSLLTSRVRPGAHASTDHAPASRLIEQPRVFWQIVLCLSAWTLTLWLD